MQVFRGLRHPGIADACALTIGNFDGVHRGHQAMLALLSNEARHRGLPSCVMTFEPHPRDYFAARAGTPEAAPRRVATLRDKLAELQRCGIDQAVVMRFDERFAAQSPQAFIDDVLVRRAGRALRARRRRLPLRRAPRRRLRDAGRDRRAPGFRRGAHDELRGARPARVELGGARRAGRRRHGRGSRAARPAVQHQRACAARPQARPRTGHAAR